jgi:uncharacterized RDD family membrane protein YckC
LKDDDPYQAPGTVLVDPVPEHTLVPADRLTRLVASIVDSLLVGVVMLPVVFLAMRYSGLFDDGPSPRGFEILQGGGQLALQLGVAAAGFLLFLLIQGYPLARYGQTWAKRWFVIRIVDDRGHKPEFVRLVLLRYAVGDVVGLVPCLGALYWLADPLCIFRDDRRCIHDLIAGTRVVQGSPDATDATDA